MLSSFVNQQNFNNTPAGSDELNMYPNGPAAAFYPQAMFYTTSYGFLLPQPELARFKLAVDRDDAWNVDRVGRAPRLHRRARAARSGPCGR